MKKLFSIIVFVAMAVIAVAQTPQTIISRMEENMSKHENEGVVMIVDVKIPILGTMTTKTYGLADKTRTEVSMKGMEIITWTEGETSWTYNSKSNEVEIQKINADKSSESEGDMEMFSGITDGYDVTIDKETSKSWTILCKRSKSNKDKDAPKKMELVVAKETYMPISLKTKMSGMNMTMRDIFFGVTEKQVTFSVADYPGVKIVDKR